MDIEAKLVLEQIVRGLERQIGNPERDYVKNVEDEYVESDDIGGKIYLELSLLLEFREATMESVGKIIAGDNIFTPSLLNRGWKVWKRSPLSIVEKLKLQAAYDKYLVEIIGLGSNAVDRAYETADSKGKLLLMASYLQESGTTFSKLSVELKEIIQKT